MKKFYNYYLSIILIAGLNISQLSATDNEQPVFEVRGFNPTEWNTPKVLDNGESKITVSFKRYSFEEGNSLWVDGNFYDKIEYVRLNDSSNESDGSNIENNIDYSSYILFEIPEGYPAITKVELVAYSFGAGNIYDTSNLIESYSKTDNTNSAYQLTNPTNTFEPWATGYSVLGPSDDIIGNGNSITHLIGRYDATYTSIDPIPANSENELKEIRFIRINWSSADFGGLSYMGRGRPLALFGFNIYTNEQGNTTGLENDNESLYKLVYKDNTISLSENSNIVVYNLSGNIAYQRKNLKSIDISSLSSGLYIIKAQSEVSGEIITKKINKIIAQ